MSQTAQTPDRSTETLAGISCDNCSDDEQRIVPVLDKRMLKTVSNYGGNRFRSKCDECGVFGRFISREMWESHPNPHIIPADAPPGGDVKTYPVRSKDDPNVNEFVCPEEGCDAFHRGYPETCDSCGILYEWEDNE